MSQASEQTEKQMPVGVAAVFAHYIADGPSYSGRVEVRVHDGHCHVTTWDEASRSSTATTAMPLSTPNIAEVLDLNGQRIEQAFNSVSNEARSDYLGNDIANMKRERVSAVKFADGVEGAIVLWGECCFVSVVRFGGNGGVEQFLEVN